MGLGSYVLNEDTCNMDGVHCRVNGGEAIGLELVWAGTEYGMGMGWTETQGLASAVMESMSADMTSQGSHDKRSGKKETHVEE